MMTMSVQSMQKVFGYMMILLGILGLAYVPFVLADGSAGLTYPLGQISKLECRQTPWEQLPESCRIDLPRIDNAAYHSYSANEDYTKIYTMLRGGAYNQFDWNQIGSHPAVDIATSQGTPVYALADATVEDARYQAGYGNVIKLKFSYKGQTYYATYAHLDNISPEVAKGKTVNQGQMIGRVGNTGFAGGAMGGFHLHFEINVPQNDRLVYAFYGCDDRKMGSNELGVINGGLCRTELEQRTLDPIAFLEKADAEIKGETRAVVVSDTDIIAAGDPIDTTNEFVTVPVTEPEEPENTNIAFTDISLPGSELPSSDTLLASADPVSDTSLGPVQSIETLDLQTTFLSREVKSFLETYTFDIQRYPQAGELHLGVKDKAGKVYEGFMPESLDILSAQSAVTISPVSVYLMLEDTKIDIKAQDDKAKDIVINFAGQRLAVFTLEAREKVEEPGSSFICLYDREERMKYFF